MGQKVLSVGTVPVEALPDTPGRRGWEVVYPAATVVAANAGRVHIGLGFVPSTDPTGPDAGIVLLPGQEDGEPTGEGALGQVWTGALWVVATIAAQTVFIRELVSQPPPAIAGAGSP